MAGLALLCSCPHFGYAKQLPGLSVIKKEKVGDSDLTDILASGETISNKQSVYAVFLWHGNGLSLR